MKPENIDSRLKEIEEQIATFAKYKDLMDKLLNYDGEDRIVPAEEVYNLAKERNSLTTALKSGIEGLDSILGGFHAGQLIVASGGTGSGKTQVLEFLTWLLAKQGNNCLWFNYEVEDEEFFNKMPDQFKGFYMPKKLVHNRLKWVEERIIEGIAKHNTNVVFIDHMHFIIDFSNEAKMANSSIYIGTILRDLKRIALEHNIVIFLVSHMKKVESGKEPDISDMRDSSFVGQEADTVLMIMREEEKRDGITHKTNKVSVIVRKNRRTGKMGHCNLWFSPTTKEFYENQSDAYRFTAESDREYLGNSKLQSQVEKALDGYNPYD